MDDSSKIEEVSDNESDQDQIDQEPLNGDIMNSQSKTIISNSKSEKKFLNLQKIKTNEGELDPDSSNRIYDDLKELKTNN